MQVVRGQEMKPTRLRAITLNTGTALHRQPQLYGDLLEPQALLWRGHSSTIFYMDVASQYSLRQRLIVIVIALGRFWGLYVHVCKMETLREAYELLAKGLRAGLLGLARSGRFLSASPLVRPGVSGRKSQKS
jgi:hypothetical protein